MRYILPLIISLLAVAVCILLFNHLFNQTFTNEVKAEEPDIVFVDEIYFSENQACKQARIDIINYLKQPELACQVDQDCHFFKYHSFCGNAPVTNTMGHIKLNSYRKTIEENCMYIVQNIPMCTATPFHGHQPVCLNNQCISLPKINEPMLNKQIHDANRLLQLQSQDDY